MIHETLHSQLGEGMVTSRERLYHTEELADLRAELFERAAAMISSNSLTGRFSAVEIEDI